MEDVHLLSQLSFDLNLLKLEEFINQIIIPDFSNFSAEQDILFTSDDTLNSYNFFYALYNNPNTYINWLKNNDLYQSEYRLIEDQIILDEIYSERMLKYSTIFHLSDIELSRRINNLEENEFYIGKFDTNKILRQNLNFQESFYYNRRLNQISFYFNPYIEVFNEFFNLKGNNNELYSVTDPINYKWWEFKYLYTILKSRKNYLNLSNLTYSINRDIVIHSWEYHHSMSFEYIWALFPTIVILSIVGPSFILLYSSVSYNDSFFTVKVIGHQWYWSYD